MRLILDQAAPPARRDPVSQPPPHAGVTIVVREGASVTVNDRPDRYPAVAGAPGD